MSQSLQPLVHHRGNIGHSATPDERERHSVTQPQHDPWAAAGIDNTAQQTPPANQAPPANQGGGSQLATSYANKPSSLFSGGGEALPPSLFNLSHAPGTTFSGKIVAPPRDVHSTSHPNASKDGRRYPLYWVTDAQGNRRPGTEPTDPRTGEKNDPVKDTVVELQTDLRMTSAEMLAVNPNRDPNYVDDGKRVWQVSGSKRPKGHVAGQPTNPMRALLDAIEEAAGRLKIVDDESLVGKTLTVKRVQRLQPGVQTSPWTFVAKLDA